MKKLRLAQLLGTGIVFILLSAANVHSATINWMGTTFRYSAEMSGTTYTNDPIPYSHSAASMSSISSGDVTQELNASYSDTVNTGIDATLYGGGTGGETLNGAYVKAYASAAFNLESNKQESVNFSQDIVNWVRREFNVDAAGNFNLSGSFEDFFNFTSFRENDFWRASYNYTGGIQLEEIVHENGSQSLSTVAELSINQLMNNEVRSGSLKTDDGQGNEITYSLMVGFTGASSGIHTEYVNLNTWDYPNVYQGDLDEFYEVSNQGNPLVINAFIESSQVPIPGTMMLFLSGIGALFGFNFSLRSRRGFKI